MEAVALLRTVWNSLATDRPAPTLKAVRHRAVATLKADADRFAQNVAPVIREIQSSGVASNRGVARALNARGVSTARGGEWTAVQIGSILKRVA
jgi:hypothetical protein